MGVPGAGWGVPGARWVYQGQGAVSGEQWGYQGQGGGVPVIVLGQGHLLKVHVQPVALRGLQDPVAGQVVAVVAGKTRRYNPAHRGVPNQPSTGSYAHQGERETEKGRR